MKLRLSSALPTKAIASWEQKILPKSGNRQGCVRLFCHSPPPTMAKAALRITCRRKQLQSRFRYGCTPMYARAKDQQFAVLLSTECLTCVACLAWCRRHVNVGELGERSARNEKEITLPSAPSAVVPSSAATVSWRSRLDLCHPMS